MMKPSPELLEMARKFIKDQGVSTQWTDHRIAMAEFGELVARDCARIADGDPDPYIGILQHFNLKGRLVMNKAELRDNILNMINVYFQREDVQADKIAMEVLNCLAGDIQMLNLDAE